MSAVPRSAEAAASAPATAAANAAAASAAHAPAAAVPAAAGTSAVTGTAAGNGTPAAGASGQATHAEPPLRIERDGPVARITLDRPGQFNALSESMLAALQDALESVGADGSVRVVVLAGSGRAFCAGHDLREMRAQPSLDYYKDLFARCAKVMMAIAHLPQPVVARVHGIATAAGCQLVAACDLAVASTEARFAVSGVNLGLFCSTPSVALSRNLSRKAAFEMLVTGEFIDAATARQQGLVNRVVPPERLDDEVAQLCASIVAKPAAAIALGKELFYRQLEMGVEAAYQLAGQTMACNMMDASALEGTQAFLDKRKPNW